MKNSRLVSHSLSSQIKHLISLSLHPQALKSSLANSSPFLTNQTYALFIKSGHSLDPHLSSALISHFSKHHNDLSRARSFLYDTRNPDVITYNALISGFARFGQSQSRHVFRLVNELRHLGLVPDVFTFSSLVKASDSPVETEVAHGVCLRLGFGSGAFVVSGLVENYARNGDIVSAERCFQECLDVDHVVWSAMVSGYVWNEEFEKGKRIFVEMNALGFKVNEFSLTGMMGALFDVREGEQIHGFGVKMGFLCGGSLHLSNAVMSMYSRCGRSVDAIKVFDEITDPDVVSWTERIGAASDGEEAMEIFRSLVSSGLEINEYTLITVLSAIGGLKFLEVGKQIQALCHKAGYLELVSVGNALVSMYGKCRRMAEAKRVFDSMFFRDSVSWNSMIAACSDNGVVHDGLEVFSKMRDLSLRPTIYTLASILEMVSNSNFKRLAMQIQSLVVKCGFMLDDSVVSCLIAAYGRCNGVEESKRVFAEMDKVNLVVLNAMIATMVHAGCYADALTLFETSWASGLNVDGTTFSIMLKACGALTDMESGRAVHSIVLKAGFAQDSFVESALVDIHCKCGSIREAEKAFSIRSSDNLAAWNAMIMGYAQHGFSGEVFKLFKYMSECGIEPDEITYLGVLTSCCHAGLLKQARYYLNSMFELHSIIPQLIHYACMIDLLGRAGLLEEAKETIDNMPIQPDAHVWQILLSACNIHGHVELGRVAASQLLGLEPENESAYILLSNLYASAGMWNAVGKLRREMKMKVPRKEPGSSWIQVGGSIHNFFVDDKLHAQNKRIHVELDRLYENMELMPELEKDGSFTWIYSF